MLRLTRPWLTIGSFFVAIGLSLFPIDSMGSLPATARALYPFVVGTLWSVGSGALLIYVQHLQNVQTKIGELALAIERRNQHALRATTKYLESERAAVILNRQRGLALIDATRTLVYVLDLVRDWHWMDAHKVISNSYATVSSAFRRAPLLSVDAKAYIERVISTNAAACAHYAVARPATYQRPSREALLKRADPYGLQWMIAHWSDHAWQLSNLSVIAAKTAEYREKSRSGDPEAVARACCADTLLVALVGHVTQYDNPASTQSADTSTEATRAKLISHVTSTLGPHVPDGTTDMALAELLLQIGSFWEEQDRCTLPRLMLRNNVELMTTRNLEHLRQIELDVERAGRRFVNELRTIRLNVCAAIVNHQLGPRYAPLLQRYIDILTSRASSQDPAAEHLKAIWLLMEGDWEGSAIILARLATRSVVDGVTNAAAWTLLGVLARGSDNEYKKVLASLPRAVLDRVVAAVELPLTREKLSRMRPHANYFFMAPMMREFPAYYAALVQTPHV